MSHVTTDRISYSHCWSASPTKAGTRASLHECHRSGKEGTRLTSGSVSAGVRRSPHDASLGPAAPGQPRGAQRREEGPETDAPRRRGQHPGQWGSEGGEDLGTRAGPGARSFPQGCLPSPCRLGPVTHSDTRARTTAIATAPLEGPRTSWASSAALRHATGTS